MKNIQSRPVYRGLFLWCVCLFGLVVLGCGTSAEQMIADANDTNVKRLATMYSFFHMRNDYKGPVDEAEFKAFIEKQDAKRLALAGIKTDELDTLFINERDGQPFKIRYGMNTRVRGPSMPVIFEAEGVDGIRHVGFTGGSMQEVDDSEYHVLWNSKFDEPDTIDAGRGEKQRRQRRPSE